MSGHSKWSTIKRKKDAADSTRGKIFTKLAREIMVAAREGGGDPNGNSRLRVALAAAKTANMPKDSQNRAIRKGTGELEGMTLEEAVYEGRGPSGVALIMEVVTDNKNRTVSEIRHLFMKAGGELGTNGSVAWMFERKGVICIPKSAIDEDALMERVLEAGGDDVQEEDDEWIVLTDISSFADVQAALEQHQPSSAEIRYIPKPESTVELQGEPAKAVARFLSQLDDHDDVQKSHMNANLPDEVLEEYGS